MRRFLREAGALPADDWLLVAGWEVWRVPQDRAFVRLHKGELYLSRRALRQLRVRFVVEGDRVVIWNGSYRLAVRLDGRDGLVEGGEVWLRVLALKARGLYEVIERRDAQMLDLLAARPAEEAGKQGGVVGSSVVGGSAGGVASDGG